MQLVSNLHAARSKMVLWIIACALVLGFGPEPLKAGPPVESPEAFFTNLADRLLQDQLGVRLAEIQIAPTNQYGTAVHRLLQVTANLYDATSTN